MTHVMLAAHPSVGHTNALRTIGRRLLKMGHRVSMAMAEMSAPQLPFVPEPVRAAAQLPDAIRRDGFTLVTLPSPLRAVVVAARLPLATGYDEVEIALELFTTGLEQQARVIAAEALSRRVDVIVTDYLLVSSLFAAQLVGLPCAALYHSALPFPIAGAPPFGAPFLSADASSAPFRDAEARFARVNAQLDARVAEAARALGLAVPQSGALARPCSRDLNLLATAPSLEPGLLPLEGPVVFTGPCIEHRPDERPDDPALLAVKPDKRNVYVSLGTVFNDKPEVFATLLRGLERDDVNVIVSAGAAAQSLSRRPPTRNASIFARVPQLSLLSRVDAVVTHGGNNTTQETLAAGRPLLVVPFGGDQLENARRVERLGVGLALLPSQLSADSVGQKVGALLGDASYRERARQVAGSLAGQDGVGVAVEAILRLAARG